MWPDKLDYNENVERRSEKQNSTEATLLSDNAVAFNVNHYVYVKLTDIGRKELRRQHDEICKQIGIDKKYAPYPEDSGWSKWQLHDLMRRLGHMMSRGMNIPFETEILFGR